MVEQGEMVKHCAIMRIIFVLYYANKSYGGSVGFYYRELFIIHAEQPSEILFAPSDENIKQNVKLNYLIRCENHCGIVDKRVR